MNLVLPSNNPIADALTFIAPPRGWAEVVRLTQPRPERLRVRLRLQSSDTVHQLEFKFGDQPQAERIWREFEIWYEAVRTIEQPATEGPSPAGDMPRSAV